MTRLIPLYFLSIALVSGIAFGQKAHTFVIASGQFLYDGQPIQVHAGRMYYTQRCFRQ